jgi:hypothetical protein
VGILDDLIGSVEELFGIDEENGPCCECLYQNSDICDRFHKDKVYDRVTGTSTTYYTCREARSSNGFCGHKGKYWLSRKDYNDRQSEKRRKEDDALERSNSTYTEDYHEYSGPYS